MSQSVENELMANFTEISMLPKKYPSGKFSKLYKIICGL